MPRKQHCFHYLYKTTNLINNKYYYGMHSTSNLDDGYLGSGKILRRAIRKYRKENFKQEIIKMFNTRDELIQNEINLITEDILNDPMCMNIKSGGDGGWNHINYNKNLKSYICGKWFLDSNNILKHKKRINDLFLNGINKPVNWTGKTHSEETKKKMSESSKGKGIGNTNSQFGTCWITNNIENKKIKKEELDQYINNGWSKGRK